VASRLLRESDEKIDSWFEKIIVENTILSGTFYFSLNTTLSQINPDTNIIEKINTKIINSNYFSLDTENNNIEFYGNLRGYSKFITNVNNTIEIIDSVDSPEVNLHMYLVNLLSRQIELRLVKITLHEIEFEETLIGKYEARVSENANPIEIVEKYGEKIIAFTLIFFFTNEEIKISITRSGSYRIRCLEKNLNEIVDILKTTQNSSYA